MEAVWYTLLISCTLIAVSASQDQTAANTVLGTFPKRDYESAGPPRLNRRDAGSSRFFISTRYGKRSSPVTETSEVMSYFPESRSNIDGERPFFGSRYGKRELAGYGGSRGGERFFINGRYGKRGATSETEDYSDMDMEFKLQDYMVKCFFTGVQDLYACKKIAVTDLEEDTNTN